MENGSKYSSKTLIGNWNEEVALKRAEDNSEELLNSGYLTYLDLLTARENSLKAELSLVDNKLDQLSATVELYRSLGGGWQ